MLIGGLLQDSRERRFAASTGSRRSHRLSGDWRSTDARPTATQMAPRNDQIAEVGGAATHCPSSSNWCGWNCDL